MSDKGLIFTLCFLVVGFICDIFFLVRSVLLARSVFLRDIFAFICTQAFSDCVLFCNCTSSVAVYFDLGFYNCISSLSKT